MKERSLGFAYTFKIHLELHGGNYSDHGFWVCFFGTEKQVATKTFIIIGIQKIQETCIVYIFCEEITGNLITIVMGKNTVSGHRKVYSIFTPYNGKYGYPQFVNL